MRAPFSSLCPAGSKQFCQRGCCSLSTRSPGPEAAANTSALPHRNASCVCTSEPSSAAAHVCGLAVETANRVGAPPHRASAIKFTSCWIQNYNLDRVARTNLESLNRLAYAAAHRAWFCHQLRRRERTCNPVSKNVCRLRKCESDRSRSLLPVGVAWKDGDQQITPHANGLHQRPRWFNFKTPQRGRIHDFMLQSSVNSLPVSMSVHFTSRALVKVYSVLQNCPHRIKFVLHTVKDTGRKITDQTFHWIKTVKIVCICF